MKTTQVGSFDAKVHLSELLNKVTNGDTITITKHGKPIAKLVPFKEKAYLSRSEALSKLSKIRNAQKTSVSVLEMIAEGRKR